jgi:hypothetical protein
VDYSVVALESDPDFIHFFGAEQLWQILCKGPDKCNVRQIALLRCFGSAPHPGSFLVNANEVFTGYFVAVQQYIHPFRIRLQGSGMIIAKIIGGPSSLHRKSYLQLFPGGLKKMSESSILCEL